MAISVDYTHSVDPGTGRCMLCGAEGDVLSYSCMFGEASTSPRVREGTRVTNDGRPKIVAIVCDDPNDPSRREHYAISSKPAHAREGAKLTKQPDWAGDVVDMIIFKDRLLVACQQGVFFLSENDELVPIRFIEEIEKA